MNLHHSDVKPYHCEYCPYKAKLKSYLKNHTNNCHSDGKDVKWYKCELCPYKNKYGSNFRKHKKTHLGIAS